MSERSFWFLCCQNRNHYKISEILSDNKNSHYESEDLQIFSDWKDMKTYSLFLFQLASTDNESNEVLIIGVIIAVIIIPILIVCICCCFKSGRKCLKGIISCFCGYAIGNYLSEKLFWTFIIAYNFFINRRHEIHKIIKQRYIPTRGSKAILIR